jgi:hypothetical protein
MLIVSSVSNENAALFDRAMKWLRVDERDSRWIRWAFVLAAFLYFICLAMLGTGPINRYGDDVFPLLDGSWRILNGQIPHRDFYLALGPLEPLLTAAGMLLTHGSPQGIAVGNVAFGMTIGIWGWLLSRRRMPAILTLIVTAWLILTATCPTPLGSSPIIVSCAMIYNREAYALLGLVLVECAFASEYSLFWGGVSSGIALVLLAFLKLTFFGVAGLLILASVPLRREEMQRAWGILAGLSCTVAVFALYLRFAIFAFLFDMRLAIQARGSSLSFGFAGSVSEIAGSAEMVTLVIMTVIVTLVTSREKLWQRHGVRVILLGCIVVAGGVLLKRADAAESGFQLATLWTVVLIGYLTAAYPDAKEKIAIPAIILLSLGSVAVPFFMGAESVGTLLRYYSASVRSRGASIVGHGMDNLMFYDDPHEIFHDDPSNQSILSSADNGHFYVVIVNDGLALLERSSTPEESVLTVGFDNPFSYILRRKPAMGGSPWLALGVNISRTHLLEANRAFGNADLIMVPIYPSSHQKRDADIEEVYHPYLSQHFAFVASSQRWSLYRRKR